MSAAAQIGSGIDMGVGTRARAFAGNHTAVANDMSAAYWNPAALAFLPVREFQLSFDGMRTFGTCDITGDRVDVPAGAKNDDYKDRLRLGSIGAMTAMPTVRGGLTIAAAYERPLTFDDFSVYEYRLPDDTENIGADYVRYGDLNRLSVAFGVQVAPNISAGLAVSVVTGSSETILDQKKNGGPYNDYKIKHSYLGYSFTLGALYLPTEYLKLGMRLNTLMSLDVKESWTTKYAEGEPIGGFSGQKFGPLSGKAYMAPHGAVGAGFTLPWLTSALDIRFTMPYTFVMPGENIPDRFQARDFKMGGGLGFEVPVPATSLVLRTGYSFDDYDLYPLVHKMEGDDVFWEEGDGFEIIRNKHTLTFGFGYFTSGFGLELSYSWQTWGLAHQDDESAIRIEQAYSNHRVMAGIIFRY